MISKELSELYQEVILDHNKNPRNFGTLDEYNHHAKGNNPLCGDNMEIFLVIENDTIQDVKFNSTGCAISKASASVMTTLLKGKTISEARQLFSDFHKAVTDDPTATHTEMNLGKLQVFCGVKEFPARVKCASLAWHTLINAIDNVQDVAKTE